VAEAAGDDDLVRDWLTALLERGESAAGTAGGRQRAVAEAAAAKAG
jgi:hypothetical protein